jgi:hypothetical protein
MGERLSGAGSPRGYPDAMEANTTVWLSKPHAPESADEVEVMRRAVAADGLRADSLAAHCLEAAQARGLSTEETYLFLAYEALLQLEETRQRHIFLSEAANPETPVGAEGGVGAEIATRAGELVRRVVDFALRTERAAAAHLTRTPVGRG